MVHSSSFVSQGRIWRLQRARWQPPAQARSWVPRPGRCTDQWEAVITMLYWPIRRLTLTPSPLTGIPACITPLCWKARAQPWGRQMSTVLPVYVPGVMICFVLCFSFGYLLFSWWPVIHGKTLFACSAITSLEDPIFLNIRPNSGPNSHKKSDLYQTWDPKISDLSKNYRFFKVVLKIFPLFIQF